ncbi:unnamed protein product, partial [Timema podura]|nr:unnamed protein product [Timema podura]
MSVKGAGNAWVTLVTNDSYALGALVLANSLIRANTIHNLVVLVTPGVTSSMSIENKVFSINVIFYPVECSNNQGKELSPLSAIPASAISLRL